jgi:ribosomal protein S25
MTDELLTIDEAARLAHVTRETIRYWLKTKRLASTPIRTSARSGKPYGKLVRRTDVLAASPTTKIRMLKESHAGKLLTVSEICSALDINPSVAYVLIRRFNLDKVYIDGWSYMVDGEQLWHHLQSDQTYWYLTLRK